MNSICIVCEKEFKEGDELQAFLSCDEDPQGSWTKASIVDSKFQNRHAINQDNVKRKHSHCESDIKGKYDDHESPLKTQLKKSKVRFLKFFKSYQNYMIYSDDEIMVSCQDYRYSFEPEEFMEDLKECDHFEVLEDK